MASWMDLSLCELCDAIQSGRCTPLESITACFERLEKLNPVLNAFTVVCKEKALEIAKHQTKEDGPLAGVPLAVKDLEDVEGLPTSYGAVPFKSNIAQKDSPQVARLKRAGAIVVGKTNVPVFGATIFSKNLAFGTTHSAWAYGVTPGGSSGGSAAAVAACIVPLATAADGGGSIRNPACFSRLFGIKPTRGVVPMTEGIGFKMDRYVHCVCFGPVTRMVEDAAMILDITRGYHPEDPFSIPRSPRDFMDATKNQTSIKERGGKLRILYSADFGFVSYVDKKILEYSEKAGLVFRDLGHDVEIRGMGESPDLIPDLGMSWPMAMGVQERTMVEPHLTEEAKTQVDKSVISAWEMMRGMDMDQFADIYRDVHKLNAAINKIFSEYDVLLCPAMPISPFSAGGPVPLKAFDVPLHVAGFLYPFNFSGNPACVIPFPGDPRTEAGAPLGAIQIVADRHQDHLLFELAKLYEDKVRPFSSGWPTEEAILSSKSNSKL